MDLQAQGKTLFVVGATVLVGEELVPLPDGVVEIHNGAIAAVGAASEVRVPRGAEVFDAGGTTLVPGYIDAHVHIGFVDPRRVLSGGVTSVRDLAWPPEIIFPLTRRSADDAFEGPQVFAAGPMLTAPGGYPTSAAWAPEGTGLAVSSPDEVPDVIAHLAAEKAAIVKVALNPEVGPVLDQDTLEAIVKEAHLSGMKVTGHVTGLRELRRAVAAGIDELAHMLMGSEEIPDDLMSGMVDRGIAIVPTLAIRTGGERRTAVANLRRFRQAGGKVVYGTDLGNEGVAPGIDRSEVKLMVRAGMTPLDVIRSATVDSAEWFGLRDRGAIAEGKRADLVGLAGISSAAELVRVRFVFRGGRLIRN